MPQQKEKEGMGGKGCLMHLAARFPDVFLLILDSLCMSDLRSVLHSAGSIRQKFRERALSQFWNRYWPPPNHIILLHATDGVLEARVLLYKYNGTFTFRISPTLKTKYADDAGTARFVLPTLKTGGFVTPHFIPWSASGICENNEFSIEVKSTNDISNSVLRTKLLVHIPRNHGFSLAAFYASNGKWVKALADAIETRCVAAYVPDLKKAIYLSGVKGKSQFLQFFYYDLFRLQGYDLSVRVRDSVLWTIYPHLFRDPDGFRQEMEEENYYCQGYYYDHSAQCFKLIKFT
jgi:hypothetical protein